MSLVTVLDNVTETTNGMPAYVSTTSDLLDIFNVIGGSARDNQDVLGMILANVTETTNGMPAYVSTTSDLLDIFNVIGSSARDNQDVLGMISKFAKKQASADEKLLLRKLLFWSRDKRCGCGVAS